MIWALLELQFCDSERSKQFHCSTCSEQIKKLRQCKSSRLDFTEKDGSFWPIRLFDGGELYSFCPAKATQMHDVVACYRTMVLCAETGALWEAGGIADQSAIFVEIASEFLPRYNDLRFNQRAKAILGDGKKTQPTKGFANGNQQKRSNLHGNGK